jgi:RHS repeat-associated protein
MSIRRTLTIAMVAAAWTLATVAHAAEDPGPSRISLPEGPGSIEGLGSDFAPSLASGTASYGIDIELPPAVGGFSPKLRLEYDSGAGASELGIGWRLAGLPKIRRRTDQGIPRFDATDAFEIAGIGLPSDLLEIAPGTFRPQHENGDFPRVRRSDDGQRWEARAKDGTTYRFGGEGYVEAEAKADGTTAVATYLLAEQLDLHGHAITYHWSAASGFALLDRVVFNELSDAARIELAFTYEARPDTHLTFASGIRRELTQRLASIEVTRGGALVRRYELGYADDDGHSRLARVDLVGADDKTALPPTTFTYTEPSFAAGGQLTAMTSAPGRSPADSDVALTDLDGDSLPDVLVAKAGQFRSYVNHDGVTWQPTADWAPTESPSVSLGETGVQLADLNGDGAVDLVIKSGTASFRYLPGASATSFGTAVPIASNPSFSFEDPDVRLADMDGDRTMDVVLTTAAGLAIGYNLDGQDFSEPIPLGEIDPTQSLRFSDGHTQLCDANGDGVRDFCRLRSESLVYYLGRGRGRFESAMTATGVPSWPSNEVWQLTDLNGDGWVDLLHVGVGQVEVALATGLGAFGPVRTVTGTPEKSSDGHVELADMNGSGTTDIVWIDVNSAAADAWCYLELFPHGRAGLLRQVDNGLGKVVTIDYEAAAQSAARAREAGNPWTTRMNVGMPVVRRVTVDSSLGDPLLVTEYDYGDGTWDPYERTFAGFGHGLKRELGDDTTPTLITDSTFDTGLTHRVLRGLPLRTELRASDGTVFTRTTTSYATPLLETALDGRRVEYGYRSRERIEHVEGQATAGVRTVLTEWEEDELGNLTREAKWGEVSGDDVLVGNDEDIVLRTYANNEDDWILGKVATERLEDAAGKRIAEKRWYYDGEPFEGAVLGTVTRGDLRRVDSWIEGDRWASESRNDHDEHGNVTVTFDVRGSRTELTYDADSATFVEVERRFASVGVEPLVRKATYDPRFGAVEEMTDPNHQVTAAAYDALGRVTAVAKPGDTLELPTLSFAYMLGAPLSHVKTEQREVSGESGTLVSVTYTDGLGRRRGTFAEAAQSGAWILSEFAVYDARGKASFVAFPTEETSADLPASPGARKGTWTLRDATGRSVSTVHSDGASTLTEYLPLARTEHDENDTDAASKHAGTPTTYVSDGLGRLVRVVERAREGTDSTEPTEITSGLYSYDPAGKVTSIRDAAAHTRRYTYDGRGRRVTIDDPNAGQWTLDYTDGNDLAVRHDPAGHIVRWTYDAFGRPLTETLQLSGESEQLVTTYHYDASAPDRDNGNTRGRLSWVEDAAGVLTLDYTARGLVAREERRWTDGTETSTFTDFDAADRAIRRGFPDGSYLSISYDSRGLVAALGPVARDISWTAAGELGKVTFGNGVTDVREYDERQRLTGLSAKAEGGTVLRDLHLTLDAASRITGLEDGRSNVAAVASLTSRFGYDDRYRLVSATDRVATTTWQYDNVSNILAVESGHEEAGLNVSNKFGEAGAGPDQLTHFGDEAIGYDAAGRVTKDGERTLSWDAKGRLVKIVRGEVTEEYVYDHADVRALKRTTRGGVTETVRYIAKDAEERDGKLVRYVFLGEQRIARLDSLPGERGAIAPAAGTALRPTQDRRPPWELAWLALGAGALVVVLRRKRWSADDITFTRFSAGRWGAAVLAAGTLAPACQCSGESSGGQSEAGPIDQLPADAVLYLNNRQGSPLVTTNAAGAVVREVAYHPYGSIRYARGDDAEVWSFVGNEVDRGSGLGDFGARPYRAEAGVFLAPDPVPLFEVEQIFERYGVESTNQRSNGDRSFAHMVGGYQYAANDPVNLSDSDGELAPVLAVLAVGALAGVTGSALYYGATAPTDMSAGEFGVRFTGFCAGGAIMGAGAAAMAIPEIGVGLVGGAIAVGTGAVGQGVEDVSSGVGLDPVRVAFGGLLNLAGGAAGAGVVGNALANSKYAIQGAAARGLTSIAPDVAKEVFSAEVKAAGAGIGGAAATNGFIDEGVGEEGW